MNIPAGWRITSDPTDRTKLNLEDSSDEDFFLSARFRGGIVSFGIVAKLPGKVSGVRGEDLFDLRLEWFGRDNNTAIQGRWNVAPPGESVNLELFNRLTAPGNPLPEEEAALLTFTGKMAQRKLNFTKVTFDQTQKLGSPGQYTKIVVEFAAS